MGLDTSHDCWHGPYSAFMRWREELHRYLGNEDSLIEAWEKGRYADQSVPINVLMNHSDCDGEIDASICEPLANALEDLVKKMPARALYDTAKPATERFIIGLRKAAALNEPVDFH